MTNTPDAPLIDEWVQALIGALQQADPGAHIEPRAGGETVIDGAFDLDKVADYVFVRMMKTPRS